jgi:hypothetical protein
MGETKKVRDSIFYSTLKSDQESQERFLEQATLKLNLEDE